MADIVNSRPFTYLSSDNVVEPLTPNHFLKFGSSKVNVDLQIRSNIPMSKTGHKLVAKWHSIGHLLDSYWDAFPNLYLKSLRERHLSYHKPKRGSVPFQPSVKAI